MGYFGGGYIGHLGGYVEYLGGMKQTFLSHVYTHSLCRKMRTALVPPTIRQAWAGWDSRQDKMVGRVGWWGW